MNERAAGRRRKLAKLSTLRSHNHMQEQFCEHEIGAMVDIVGGDGVDLRPTSLQLGHERKRHAERDILFPPGGLYRRGRVG